jgi:DNA-binding MarR family transcriptional regulator
MDGTYELIERELGEIVRRARGAGAALVADMQPGLDLSTYGVLVHLAEGGPMRLTDLAGRLGQDRSTASRHVAELEMAGLVERREEPGDRRAALLSVSAKGAERLAVLAEGRRQALRQLLAGWTPEERAEFARLLSRFRAGLAERLSRRAVAS